MKIRVTLDPDTKDVILDYIFEEKTVRVETNLNMAEKTLSTVANNTILQRIASLIGLRIRVLDNEDSSGENR